MVDYAQSEVLSCGYSYHIKPFNAKILSGIPSYLIRLQTEGTCHALIGDEMVGIRKGDLLIYPPGSPYHLRIEANDQEKVSSGDYFLFAQGKWMDRWWSNYPKSIKSHIHLNENIISLWRQIILEKRRLSEENRELIGYLHRALCILIDRSITETATLSLNSYTASKMKRYIEEHATQTIRVEDVADHVSLSHSRAIHLFKETYGITMIQYSIEIRLTLAIERMRYTNLTLEQISRNSGFGSYSYFHKAFTNHYGVSPKVYRNKEQIQLM